MVYELIQSFVISVYTGYLKTNWQPAYFAKILKTNVWSLLRMEENGSLAFKGNEVSSTNALGVKDLFKRLWSKGDREQAQDFHMCFILCIFSVSIGRRETMKNPPFSSPFFPGNSLSVYLNASPDQNLSFKPRLIKHCKLNK